jgi:hypothetical protein
MCNTYTYRYSYSYTYSYFNSTAYAHTQRQSNTKSSPDSASPPETVRRVEIVGRFCETPIDWPERGVRRGGRPTIIENRSCSRGRPPRPRSAIKITDLPRSATRGYSRGVGDATPSSRAGRWRPDSINTRRGYSEMWKPARKH